MTASASLDFVKDFVIATTVIAILLSAWSVLWGVPLAAEKLQEQAKEKDPSLWQEYEAKLGPGETLARRPDLFLELSETLNQKNVQKLKDLEEMLKQATANGDFESEEGNFDDLIERLGQAIEKEEGKKP